LNSRFFEWIWNIKGSLALAPTQSSDDAFDRLDPLFQQTGTSYERTRDTLVFSKKNQAAQDKMSIFNGGVLQVERGHGGSVLRYRLTSRALLYCFLAPLLFLGIAQLTVAIGEYEKAAAEAEKKVKKESADEKDPAEKYASLPMNPIDKFLGAPAPEKPKKDKEKDKDKKDDFSPKAAYIFAGIFAALYLVGRVLEDWLIKKQFRRRLLGA
jgi:hypothetical protein